MTITATATTRLTTTTKSVKQFKYCRRRNGRPVAAVHVNLIK